MTANTSKTWAAMALTILVSACGGGGDGGSNTPSPPAISAPTISVQPLGTSALTGGTATFSVTASGTGLSYQWNRNGVPVAGATAASYTTPALTYADSAATYTVTVSNSGGQITSQSAQLALTASANQRIFEELILSPSAGSFALRWNLNLAGPQITGTNYLFSDSSSLTQSPLTNGPQTSTQTAPQNMATSLAMVAEAPLRVLKNGVVLVVPAASGRNVASYVGSDVQVDFLANDNTTVAYTQARTDYSFTPLAGLIKIAPNDFAHWYNSLFANPAALSGTATYAAGAGYVKFTTTSKGDRYTVFDCSGATTGNTPVPCVPNSTLDAALTTGLTSNSDGRTYHQADGTVSTIGGVPMFVATLARPFSATLSATTQYRTYFQLNGNVYTGALVKDGAILAGSNYVSNPAGATAVDRITTLPYSIRMNQAARDSLKAAVTY
ncbi:MAG: hypothetical protein IPG93_01365 [Burkholderiales bacterium]|nr:hypothetical protein [Burkholderiales bacterium]